MSAELPWEQLGHQIAAEIADHPMVRGFEVSVAANRFAVVASLQEGERTIEGRVGDPRWWEPATHARAQVIANRLAVLLYEARIDWLRQQGRQP